jgi:hypothetical protein
MEGVSGWAVAGGEGGDGRGADLRVALAAVAHQELDQVGQGRIGRAVDDRTALAPRGDQARMAQLLEMVGYGRGRDADRLGQNAGGDRTRRRRCSCARAAKAARACGSSIFVTIFK